MGHGECLVVRVGCSMVAYDGSQVGSHIPLARVSIGIVCVAGFGLCANGGDWRGVRGDWGARTRAAGAKLGAKMAARGTFGLAGHLVGAEGLRCGLSHRKVEACARALGGCARSWCGKVMVAVRSVRAWPRGGPGASRSRVAAALVRDARRIKYRSRCGLWLVCTVARARAPGMCGSGSCACVRFRVLCT